MFGYLADMRAQFDARVSDLDAHTDDLLAAAGGSSASSSHSHSSSSSSIAAFWSSAAAGAGWNMSPLLNAVVWLHQVAAKVKQTALIVARVLPGVAGIDRFQARHRAGVSMLSLFFYLYLSLSRFL